MSKSSSDAQSFVPIQEIRNGVIILNNGQMRALVSSDSINLSLRNEDEQTAIFYNFQTFLNSLDFPVQIFIQSKKLDIRPYLNLLGEREKQVEEDLLKIQIREYVSFIQKFTEQQNIMSKSFYVVIPYDSPQLINSAKKLTDEEFFKNFNNLMQRVNVVSSNLASVGLKINLLKTEELINLYYQIFNPNELVGSQFSGLELSEMQ